MYDYSEVKFGEIWQDGEGALLVAIADGGQQWMAFGNPEPIQPDNPKIVHPLTLVFDENGVGYAEQLRYPNGKAWR